MGAFCVEDRVRGIKAQQILMGVKRSTYWIGLFICDYLVSFILACIALIGLSAASSPTITEVRTSGEEVAHLCHGAVTTSDSLFITASIIFLP